MRERSLSFISSLSIFFSPEPAENTHKRYKSSRRSSPSGSISGIPTTPIASPLKQASSSSHHAASPSHHATLPSQLPSHSWPKRSFRSLHRRGLSNASPTASPRLSDLVSHVRPITPLSDLSALPSPTRDSLRAPWCLYTGPEHLKRDSVNFTDFLLENESDADSISLVDPNFDIGDKELYSSSVFFEHVPEPTSSPAKSVLIFEIPEIVHRILSFVDLQFTRIPHEKTLTRRNLTKKTSLINPRSDSGTLYNCLFVNKLFCGIARELIYSRVLFDSDQKFQAAARMKCIFRSKPTMIVLHKLFRSRQESMNAMTLNMDFSVLQWLEFYMCPKIAPSSAMFAHGTIRKLVITGLRVMDDTLLSAAARQSPNLEWLDLRACELVSDAGIYQVSKHCRRLTTINFGRKAHGRLVTDAAIVPLISSNRHLKTVGLAGCNISDRVVWTLAAACGASLERLSLNNCPFISDLLIAVVLQSTRYPLPRLCVLELRGNTQLYKWLAVIAFKRRQNCRGIAVLVELCATLQERMSRQQREMDAKILRQIFCDIQEWVNCCDSDTDMSYHQLLADRMV